MSFTSEQLFFWMPIATRSWPAGPSSSLCRGHTAAHRGQHALVGRRARMAARARRHRGAANQRRDGRCHGRRCSRLSGGALSRDYILFKLGQAHMNDEAEWLAALLHKRMVMSHDGTAIGPAISIHRGRISDIRRRHDDSLDYFEITVEDPFQDRNATLLGK